MKKIINILITAIVGVSMMSACNDPYGELTTGTEPKFIEVIQAQSDYSSYSGTSSLLYRCPEPVTGSSNQAWCKVTKIKEGELKVEVTTNGSIVERNAVISLRTDAGDVVKIPISQRSVILKTSPTVLRGLSETGVRVEIEVDCPVEFRHSATEPWLTAAYTVEGNTIIVDLDHNFGFPRMAYINLEVPEQGLKASIPVEQLGDVAGFKLGEKFIGTAGTPIAWYFDPAADNGPEFNSAWVSVKTGSDAYKHEELKIGRITATASSTELLQCLKLSITRTGTGRNYPHIGYRVDMTVGSIDSEVVFVLKTDLSATGGNDSPGGITANDMFYWRLGGMSAFLTKLTGAGTTEAERTKRYRIVNADDLENPTVLTFRDVDSANNWFTVTKTPVAL